MIIAPVKYPGHFHFCIDGLQTIVYNNKKGGAKLKTKNDVCKIFKVSLGTVNNWIKQGKIKAIKIGRSVRIPEEEIERIKRGE